LGNHTTVEFLIVKARYMELPRNAMLLRIFLGEADELDGEPVFRKIVFKAREMNLAGATVLRGPLGFGRSSHLHASNILRLSTDLPIVIEIVDTEEKIREFLAAVESIVGPGLITLEKVQAIFYKAKSPNERPKSKRAAD
jgi:uncharacterized protein